MGWNNHIDNLGIPYSPLRDDLVFISTGHLFFANLRIMVDGREDFETSINFWRFVQRRARLPNWFDRNAAFPPNIWRLFFFGFELIDHFWYIMAHFWWFTPKMLLPCELYIACSQRVEVVVPRSLRHGLEKANKYPQGFVFWRNFQSILGWY